MSLTNIIANSCTEGITRANLLCALGACLNECPPPVEHIVPVLATIWRLVDTFTVTSEYIACVESWTQFISQHCSLVEVNRMMGDIIGRMTGNRVHDSHGVALRSIAERLLTFTTDFTGLLTTVCGFTCEQLQIMLIIYLSVHQQDNFLSFIDLFQKDSIRQDVCKHILLECRNRSPDRTPITDPLAINALMHTSRALSDTVK